jgi:hypothetical protein
MKAFLDWIKASFAALIMLMHRDRRPEDRDRQ